MTPIFCSSPSPHLPFINANLRTPLSPPVFHVLVRIVPLHPRRDHRRWRRGLSARAASSDSKGPDDHRLTEDRDLNEAESGEVAVSEESPLVLCVPHVGSFTVRRPKSATFSVGVVVAIVLLVGVLRRIIGGKSDNGRRGGSVADLVRRGHLKSDRRGISKPLSYEDPFNNPLVKVGKNSTVEMYGKVYRLAPVTLTEEQQTIHQKRRSRAYQWKRPTVFLKEGDPVPPDVDPDTVRWIPANHPFATTVSDIDENIAQNNVYQKHGVPFRIKAEHEALQKKLEALQKEEKLHGVTIDPNTIQEFERPFQSPPKPPGQAEQTQRTTSTSKSGGKSESSESNAASEEPHKS
ncbi:hypothetical protein QJS10_CPA03g02454 [Acorus calamus]|uniref:Protein MULTIPLE CHLOROPLAST DIVISION SITE 1 n=1 Tax=Acorus calamus TaxID=4465 RepID=A0AAV9F581_ACOCL|nr:hypothetical protein QJS10_CPA03g02454 [Acorus calamus]